MGESVVKVGQLNYRPTFIHHTLRLSYTLPGLCKEDPSSSLVCFVFCFFGFYFIFCESQLFSNFLFFLISISDLTTVFNLTTSCLPSPVSCKEKRNPPQ